MSDTKQFGRRRFLTKTATAGVGALAAPAIFSNASRILGANDTLRMGIIGSGRRGRNVMGKHQKFGAQFIAVCDVYAPSLQAGLKLAPEAKTYHDYRKLLDNKDIDAVLIATPEHWHAQNLIEAVAAGKDAYCEKPMSHSIEEGVRMVRAVRETDRIVQIGMQRRSSTTMHEAKKFVKECGDIYHVKAYWHWDWARPLNNGPLEGKLDWKAFIGPARWHEPEPQRYRYWRYFWDYSGGNCTDQGTHLMDVVQWFMGSAPPRAAVCYGDVYEMTGSETPDIFSAVFEYENFMATWTLNYKNVLDNGWNIQFLGSKASLWLDNQGARLIAPKTSGTPYSRTEKVDLVKEIKRPLGDREHIKNFIDCCRSRKEPNAPVEVGHSAVCGPHLANVALLHKSRAQLNKAATKVSV